MMKKENPSKHPISDNNIKIKKKEKNIKKKKIRSRNKGGWGNLESPYKIGNFIHRYRIYRIAKWCPFLFTQIPALLYTHFVMRSNKNAWNRIFGTLKQLYPRNLISYKKYTLTSMFNMSSFLFNLFFETPNLSVNDVCKLKNKRNENNWNEIKTNKNRKEKKKIIIEGQDIVQNSLKKHKGVIMPVIHLGNFFHLAASFQSFSEIPLLVGIANPGIKLIYKDLPLIKNYPRKKFIWTTKFFEIKQQIMKYLKKNAIILIMVDFSNQSQIKVPFYKDPWDFLIPVPSSIASLSYHSGADIIPAITIPSSDFNSYARTNIKFGPIITPEPIDFKDLQDPLKRKNIYGRLMYKVNLEINGYLLKYPHFWEEILTLSTNKIREIIHFPRDMTPFEFVGFFIEIITGYLKKMYDPKINETSIELRMMSKFENFHNNKDKISFDNDTNCEQNDTFLLPLKNKKITIEYPKSIDFLIVLTKIFKKYLEINGIKEYLSFFKDLESILII